MSSERKHDPNDKFRSAVTPHNAVASWGLATNEKNQKPLSNVANAVTVLQKDPRWGPHELWYDEFLDRVLTRDDEGNIREWRDDDDTRLTVYMQQRIGLLSIPEAQVASAVRYVARQRPRHCVREWLLSLTWDQIPRIAHAFEDFLGAEPSAAQPCEYLRAVSANLFLAMVARVLRPGCQLDTMVILEGPQGIGKSRALRVIGGDWYALIAESAASKDFFQSVQGVWLGEMGELDALSKSDRERTKLAISTPTDRYRSSYGRRAEDHPRQCVFVGTTNRDDYGHDETGLRRFLPVRCGEINILGLIAARPQLFAEAVALLAQGASYWDTPADHTLAVQRDRQHDDPWTTTVLDGILTIDETTSTHVLVNVLKMREADIGRLEQNRVSAILTLNGWRRQTIRVNGRPVKGFRRTTEL